MGLLYIGHLGRTGVAIIDTLSMYHQSDVIGGGYPDESHPLVPDHLLLS